MRFQPHELEGPIPGNRPCPICGRIVALGRQSPGDTFDVDCEHCGQFTITEEALTNLWHAESSELSLLPFLAAHTRQRSERGERYTITTTDWREPASQHAGTTVAEKAEKALRFIATRSEFPGAVVKLPNNAFANLPPLFDARSVDEVIYLFRHLAGLHLVDDSATVQTERRYVVTVAGWQALQRKPDPAGTPGRCFVAMSFDATLLDAYESGIFPAVKLDCGMEPIRVDRVLHNEKICDRILAEIRLSQCVIADFTRQRPSVYFESGFAVALGRPVIWMCHESERELLDKSFDTRQYLHTFWSDPADLRSKLRDRLRAMTSLPVTPRV